MPNVKHPIQPLERDSTSILRFKENKIVKYLVEKDRGILNTLAQMNFSQEDREQFAQLIGYSLGGYSELSYVSNESYEAALKMAELGLSETDARIAQLEETLKKVRMHLKELVPDVFRIHPDDLVE